MLYELGLQNNARVGGGAMTIPTIMQMKETGRLGKGHNMTRGQIVAASVRYLPTSSNPKRVFKKRDKFFCGKKKLSLNILFTRNIYFERVVQVFVWFTVTCSPLTLSFRGFYSGKRRRLRITICRYCCLQQGDLC